MKEVPTPLDPPTKEELDAMNALTPAQLEAIDAAILACLGERGHWMKVAMVVATLLGSSVHVPGVPENLYADRIRALVAAGSLDSQGNLDFIRFSEVRLAR